MPKIISAFSGDSGLSDTMARLGASMFGNSTDNALKSEQLYALQRSNAETDNLMKRVAAAKAQNLGADPIAQAVLIGAGYDPAKFAAIGRMGAATEYGAADPRTANWQIAAGDPYTATASAFNSNLAETRRNNDLQSADRRYNVDTDAATKKWLNDNISAADQAQSADRRYNVDQSQLTERMKPVSAYDPVAKKPVLVPLGEVSTRPTIQPILSEADRKGTLLGENFNNLAALNPQQQEVLGARVTGDKAGNPKNYILPGGIKMLTYDGQTDVFGKPLPPGGYIGTVQGSAADVGVTNSVKTDEQGATIANKKFSFLVDQGMSLTQDPTLFGPVGFARSIGQEIVQGAKGVSALFQNGQPGDEALRTARADLAQNGLQNLLPEIYDPNLSKVETVWGLLVYQGAAALAGQQNRSVSDKDVQAMKQILGSPQSMFASAEAMKAKLLQAKEIVTGFDAISREALGDAAPVATPFDAGAQPGEKAVPDAGQPVQIRGADDYNALPPGAKYLDPNGVLRTKGAR